MSTPDTYTALRQALAAMTPGPWFVSGPYPRAGIYEGNLHDFSRYDPDTNQLPPKHIASGMLSCVKSINEDHDIAGIVLLRNHADALLDELDEARERLAETRGLVRDLTTALESRNTEFDAYKARWNEDQLPYKEMHDAAVARAESAEQERDALRAQLAAATETLKVMERLRVELLRYIDGASRPEQPAARTLAHVRNTIDRGLRIVLGGTP